MESQHPDTESEIVPFIAAAKSAGTADAFILDLLKASGWSERRAFGAFSTYYAATLGVPVPVRGARFEYARDGFMYLLAFFSLAAWASGVGHLLYVLIDRWFPNPLDTPYITQSLRANVSWELATIIVAYPIFMFVSTAIARQLAARPESADSGVRKWLTYIALIIAALVLLGDGIAFLQSFLHGDLTQRFVLDTVVLFALVGGIFAYYLQTLRADAVAPLRNRAFAAASALTVAGVLACGFFATGLPQQQRLLDLDDRRIDDLLAIQRHIGLSYIRTSSVPANITNQVAKGDPLTQQPYEYRRLDTKRYELCAVFATASSEAEHPRFAHGIGRTCYIRRADTDQ